MKRYVFPIFLLIMSLIGPLCAVSVTYNGTTVELNRLIIIQHQEHRYELSPEDVLLLNSGFLNRIVVGVLTNTYPFGDLHVDRENPERTFDQPIVIPDDVFLDIADLLALKRLATEPERIACAGNVPWQNLFLTLVTQDFLMCGDREFAQWLANQATESLIKNVDVSRLTGDEKSLIDACRHMPVHGQVIDSTIKSFFSKYVVMPSYRESRRMDDRPWFWQSVIDRPWFWPLVASTDGKYLAMGFCTGIIKIWDVSDWHLVKELVHPGFVYSIAWSPDGRYLASRSDRYIIKIWDTRDWHLINEIETGEGWLKSIAWSSNGKYFACVSDSGFIAIWDTSNWRVVKELAGWYTIAWSSDGKYLASGAKDCTIKIWNVDDWCLAKELSGDTGNMCSIAWSRDGQCLANASQNMIKIWKVTDWSLVKELRGHTGCVCSIAWLPDGRYLASAAEDCTIRIWNVDDQCCVKEFVSPDVKEFAFSYYMFSVAWLINGCLVAGDHDYCTILAPAQRPVTINLLDDALLAIQEIQRAIVK